MVTQQQKSVHFIFTVLTLQIDKVLNHIKLKYFAFILMPSAVNLNVIKTIFKSPEIFYGLNAGMKVAGLTNISITEIKPDYFNYFRFGTGA